jgi:hypothetical protein
MSLLICVGFVFKRFLWKKERGDVSEYPWGYYRGKMEIGIKEMTTWVTLPRDFTKNCLKNVLIRV